SAPPPKGSGAFGAFRSAFPPGPIWDGRRGCRVRAVPWAWAFLSHLRCEKTSCFGRRTQVLRITKPNLLYPDRKSTRLNSSHVSTSYAVLFRKKKTKTAQDTREKDDA